MKKVFFVFLMLISSVCFAQHRTDYWLLGYDLGSVPTLIRPVLYFNGSVMDTASLAPFVMNFDFTNSSINDSSQKMLFFSNGQWVANRNHDTLKNSFDFNPGFATNQQPQIGILIAQSVLTIPKPGATDRYSMFHASADNILINGSNAVLTLRLFYSEIDMTKDSGRGEMTKKNKIIIIDTLVKGKLTACKHANGRDWWIISHEYNTNRYYKFLLTPDSLYGPYSQYIGQSTKFDYGNSQACFSPEGDWFANIYLLAGKLDIIQFDRCTGNFYNCISIDDLPLDISAFWIGVAFSANNRFLYINNEVTLLQFDLNSSDIITSKQLIGTWNGDCSIGCSRFVNMQLARDNRIYMSPYSGVPFFHRIMYPDSLGISCNFEQRAIPLANYNLTIPIFPNYDLGPLSGSGCDTLNQPPETEFHFSLYPNPVSEQLNLTFHVENESKLKVYDVIGRKAMEFTLYPYFKSNVIDVNKLPSGLYLYEVSDAGKRLQAGKFIKVRVN